MNTLLNMNEQNVNDYQSGFPNYSENINTIPISQFSTPRPILSASAILRNGANNFYVNIGKLWLCFNFKVFFFYVFMPCFNCYI